MSSFVYIQSEEPEPGFPGLWTVGIYCADGKFRPESDHNDPEEAARRVRWLNGGNDVEVRNAATLTRDIDVAESTAAQSRDLAERQLHPAVAGEMRRAEGFAAGVAAYARLVRDGEATDDLVRLLD